MGYTSLVFKAYIDYFDRHAERIRNAVLAAEEEKYSSKRFLSDVVGCSRDSLEFWRKIPFPWTDVLQTLEIRVREGEDTFSESLPVMGGVDGVAEIAEMRLDEWPKGFREAVHAVVAQGAVVLSAKGLSKAGLKAGDVVRGQVVQDQKALCEFRVSTVKGPAKGGGKEENDGKENGGDAEPEAERPA